MASVENPVIYLHNLFLAFLSDFIHLHEESFHERGRVDS